ncbi:hypothetical protein [Aerosakkonema funiforme]|uniref:hypothetical protein n=1 Tax=Aerosakkonema funiforme TaxID=1246630 RepID=UPI0035BB84F8
MAKPQEKKPGFFTKIRGDWLELARKPVSSSSELASRRSQINYAYFSKILKFINKKSVGKMATTSQVPLNSDRKLC